MERPASSAPSSSTTTEEHSNGYYDGASEEDTPPRPPPPPGGLEAMWGGGGGGGGMDGTAGAECDCAGPPPEFLLPPPPRPPALQPPDPVYCTEDPLPIETCDALPLIDASYRSSPSLQTSAVIVLCSVLGLFVFIAIILVWKHKRKVQNFLPCKTSPQNNCDGPTTTAPPVAGIYEDLHDVIPRPTPTHLHHHHPHHHHHHTAGGGHIVAPSIEMIDVKNNIHYPSGYPISQHPPVFLCSSPGPDPYCSHQDLYNPVYEELSDAESMSELAPAPHSEDEFAEDELSLGGGDPMLMMMTDPHHHSNHQRRRCLDGMGGPPPYRPEPLVGNMAQSLRRGDNGSISGSNHHPRFRRPHEPLPPIPAGGKRHRSLDRRRQEFHEGMLLDALLQLYPRVGSVEQPSPPPPPLLNHGSQHRSTSGRQQNPNQQNPNQQQMIPSIAQRLQQTPGPYETVPTVLGHLATFRPSSGNIAQTKPYSQDSAFGSDSGYSNHTTSGTSRGSNRGGGGGRSGAVASASSRDPRRLSQLSADLTTLTS